MPRHPISYVARSTGLSTHVVRVWERRHGAVNPTRTDTNRRLYSDSDIDRLKLLHALSEAGHSIGAIAQCSDDDLREMLRNLSAPSRPAMRPSLSKADAGSLSAFMRSCQEAVVAQDESTLTQCLSEAQVGLSQPVLLEDLIAPLMNWVGDEWHEGRLRVAQEHLATTTVKSFLFRLKQSQHAAADARVVALATPSGESHEIGALLAAVAAAFEGWRPLYYGANLPASELAHAATQAGASAVALSIALPGERGQLVREIQDLRQFLPERV